MTAKTLDDFLGGDNRPKFYAVNLQKILTEKEIPACIKIAAKTIIDRQYLNLKDFLIELSNFDLTSMLALVSSILTAFESGQITEQTAVTYKNAMICALVLGQGEGNMATSDRDAHIMLLRIRSCLLVEYLIRTHNLTVDRDKLGFDTNETDLITLADDITRQIKERYPESPEVNKNPPESK